MQESFMPPEGAAETKTAMVATAKTASLENMVLVKRVTKGAG